MGTRKKTAMTAALLMFLAACSSGESESAETQRTNPPTPITPVVTQSPTPEPTATVTEQTEAPTSPKQGLEKCQREVKRGVVNPNTVEFNDDDDYERMAVSNDPTARVYSVTGTATGKDKNGETVEFGWDCRLVWEDDESWGARYAEYSGTPTVVVHKETRPATARDVCEASVRDKLGSPRIAEFTHNGHRNGALYGTVESQNRAGVWLESHWVCDIDWNPQRREWDVTRTTVG